MGRGALSRARSRGGAELLSTVFCCLGCHSDGSMEEILFPWWTGRGVHCHRTTSLLPIDADIIIIDGISIPPTVDRPWTPEAFLSSCLIDNGGADRRPMRGDGLCQRISLPSVLGQKVVFLLVERWIRDSFEYCSGRAHSPLFMTQEYSSLFFLHHHHLLFFSCLVLSCLSIEPARCPPRTILQSKSEFSAF